MKNNCIIRLMGDVMIGRLVNATITESGYEYPWGNVLPILKSEGINIINLETTLTTSKKRVPKVFNFKADPDKVQSLIEGNIHVANIANNHILDYAVEGLEETLKVLDEHHIVHTGAGRNIEEAKKPAIISYNGLTIGILGCTDNEPLWQANKYPGTFFVNIGDLQKIKSDIIKLRKEVDLLVLSIHWGPNMVEEPNEKQVRFAHELIDLGVDIIHGHSAHIFQGIELYKEKLILYDTGDFVDDYLVDTDLRNDLSFLIQCELTGKKFTRIQIIPVVIENKQVNLAKGEDKKQTIERAKSLSSPFATVINAKGEVLISSGKQKK